MDTSTAPRTTEVGAQGGFAEAPSWPAIAAWGGGLLQLALGAGAITTGGGGPGIRVTGFLLVVIGAAAIGWGAAILARGRIVVPRACVVGSLAGILGAAAALVLEPARVSVFAVAATIALLVVVALACGHTLRSTTRPPRSRPTNAEGRRVIGVVVSAVLVAALVTPALAATEAGQHAVPHGEMVEPGHH